jgi:prophage regulatory protein
MNTLKRLLRMPDVIKLVGIELTVIYERIKAGTFLAPVPIRAGAVDWDEEDLAMAAEPNARRKKSAGLTVVAKFKAATVRLQLLRFF